MTRSVTNVDFGQAGPSYQHPQTYMSSGKCTSEWKFGLAKSVCKISAKAANNEAEITQPKSIAEHAGLCKWQPWLPGFHQHWWVVDQWIWPINQSEREAKSKVTVVLTVCSLTDISMRGIKILNFQVRNSVFRPKVKYISTDLILSIINTKKRNNLFQHTWKIKHTYSI